MAKYDADSIPILTQAERVRKHPGMYLGHGSLDNDALHILIFIVADFAVSEKHCNASTEVTLVLDEGGWITIADDGRGLPVSPFSSRKNSKPKIEIIFKGWGTNPPKEFYQMYGYLGYISGVLNALSDDLRVETIVDSVQYKLRGRMGEIVERLETIGKTSEKGTRIAFLPDYASFEDAEFDRQLLEDGLQKLREKYPHVTFRLVDNRVVS